MHEIIDTMSNNGVHRMHTYACRHRQETAREQVRLDRSLVPHIRMTEVGAYGDNRSIRAKLGALTL